MKITYIHHSSFLVEYSQVYFLFDYYSGELPELSKEKPLIIFSSHFHSDHYAPVIFEFAKERSNCFYILSEDIRKKGVPEHLLSETYFVKPWEVVSLEWKEGKLKKALDSGGDIKIETFRSTDEGVAFWITFKGKQFYHAGDLNNWWWEGEDKAWNCNMAADYSRELDRMAGRFADIAFVPLDPRQEQWFYLGMDQFMKKVDVEKVFPMHFWKDYQIIQKMKQHSCSKDYRDKIMEIHAEGEEFEL